MENQDYFSKFIITVTGEDGIPLPGIYINLINDKTGEILTKQTDESGLVIFRNILSGIYTIRATLEGFSVTEKKSILVKPGKTEEIEIKLGVKTAYESEELHDLEYEESIKIESDCKDFDFVTESKESAVYEDKNFVTIPVFYGTNRKGSSEKKTNWKYGHKRGPLSLGINRVSIPKDHKMGEVERPDIFKLEFRENPEKHVVLISVNPLQEHEFFDKLKSNVQESDDKEGLIFIHGFNTTFEEATRRTAQLSYDLAVETPIMFSWPSRGKLTPRGYTRDETNISWTEADLKYFIKQTAINSGLSKLHLIAHSMGNRALTAVLSEITTELTLDNKLLINEVILTAPDIDSETFIKNIAPKIINKSDRVTLYASAHDVALNFSQQVHGYPRAGDSGEQIVVVDGIDTVDVSPLKTGFLGHDYFAENRNVVNDLFMLIKRNIPPKDRNLIKKECPRGLYWLFRG